MKPLSDLTAQCIRCGFCLESCPTFAESGDESMSPRGRIHLVKLAELGEISWADRDLHQSLDTCVGCRACEPACPSGVEYGAILEMARERLVKSQYRLARKVMLSGMAGGGITVALNRKGDARRMPAMFSRMVSGRLPEADLPQVSADHWPPMIGEVPEIRGEVVLLEGCLMKTLFPSVHTATRRLLRRAGYQVRDSGGGCCGALHAHIGLARESKELSDRLRRSLPDSIPIIVNSAGCGSHLKEIGMADRVRDISEFLFEAGFTDLLSKSPGLGATATYHDACHLAHGQRITSPPRRLLESIPRLKLVTLREADLCCGSGGIYNVTQPEMARRLLNRKWVNIEATGAEIVVLGNPGCHAWIAQAARESNSAVRVLHTAEILEASFSGMPMASGQNSRHSESGG